jgi:hypothetical protein
VRRMMRSRPLALALVAFLGCLAAPEGAVQNVLVLCSADDCTYRLVTNVSLSGHTSLRTARPPLESINQSELSQLQEVDLDRIPGLYRNSRTGVWYEVGADTVSQDLALPSELSTKTPLALGSVWQNTTIEYTPVGVKGKQTARADDFAYLLVGADSDQATSRLLQRLLAPDAPDTDNRRQALIRGDLLFNAKRPSAQAARDALQGRIRTELAAFDAQQGDPSALASTLTDAAQLSAIYSKTVDVTPGDDLMSRVSAAQALYAKRAAISDGLRAAGLWDDYLVKIRQLGLARWSLPDSLAREREALLESTKLHVDRSAAFAKSDHPDRAFDEAKLAAGNSCDPMVQQAFYNAKIQLVNHDAIASAAEYTGNQRAVLEQTVRSLEQLDPAKEQVTLAFIQQGEAIDPNYLPLQWKKAAFLDKLGRYTDGLAVLEHIERTVPLDRRELDLCLRLDGEIRINLLDAIDKSKAEAGKAFAEGRYRDVLTATARGLKADPNDATLLFYGAMAAAFLRQTSDATNYARTYLKTANVSCAAAGEPEKILDLTRVISTSTAPADPADSIPNWVSGARYSLQAAPYDPISLAFLQPISRIATNVVDGVVTGTIFERENRSFLVSSIVTTRAQTNVTAKTSGADPPLFEAEPKYDRQTLTMLEVGSRVGATSGPVHPLAYLNSPDVDPRLVLRFTGKQIARGWAGNPYFHPFVWNGFYFFDLAYDGLGRVVTATPIKEEAGTRTDPSSEPLEFTWYRDTNLLLSVRGKRSGYLRELTYDKSGRLASEMITMGKKGKGSIEYEYLPKSTRMQSATCMDDFWDKVERTIHFDWGGSSTP